MIKALHLKALFWLAVGTWALALLLSGEPVSVAILKPSGLVLGVVAASVALFERYVWRWRLLRPWFVSAPDVNGTYFGTITTSWTDPKGEVQHKEIVAYLTILQTLSSLKARLFTAESASVSLCGQLLESDDHHWEVVTTYRNEPRLMAQDRSRIHHGGTRLQIHGLTSPRLAGSYFTDRGTYGEMTFERVSRERSMSFADAAKLLESAPLNPKVKALPKSKPETSE